MATLRMKVAEICQGRDTPFTEGIPGRGWLRWWRKRHPELSLRVARDLKLLVPEAYLQATSNHFIRTWSNCMRGASTHLNKYETVTSPGLRLGEMVAHL